KPRGADIPQSRLWVASRFLMRSPSRVEVGPLCLFCLPTCVEEALRPSRDITSPSTCRVANRENCFILKTKPHLSFTSPVCEDTRCRRSPDGAAKHSLLGFAFFLWSLAMLSEVYNFLISALCILFLPLLKNTTCSGRSYKVLNFSMLYFPPKIKRRLPSRESAFQY